MNSKTLIIAAAFVGMQSSVAFSQSNEMVTSNPGFRFTSISLEGGGITSSGSNLRVENVKAYAEQSKIAKEMYEMRDSLTFGSGYFGSSQAFTGVNVQFLKQSPGRFETRLIVGFDVLKMDLGSISGNRSQSGRYDTITSSATGQSYYIDTTKYTNYNMSQQAEMTGLRFGYQISTQFESRWQFIAGINYNIRFTSKSSTSFYFSDYTSSIDPYAAHQGTNDSYKNEEFAGDKPIMNSLSVPVGVDFTVGKKRPFFQSLHLQFTAEPGFYAISNLSSGNISRSYMSFRGGIVLDFP